MYTYEGDINTIYPEMVRDTLVHGSKVTQRGLTTRELSPVIFQLPHPRRRLVTSWGRPVNVAFALAEVLWILAGRYDVKMLAHYNSRMAQFSDDGTRFNAAYGHRLRYAYGFDQLEDCISTLQADPGSRQAVLNIWLPQSDRGTKVTKDRACNLVSHMLQRDGMLHWTQFMRSNDAVWGTPYNVMQWTHIQEFVARRIGVEPGRYTHVSDSFHVYDPPLDGGSLPMVRGFDLYAAFPDAEHAPVIDLSDVLNREENIRIGHDTGGYRSAFSRDLSHIFRAHALYRHHHDMEAYAQLLQCPDQVYGAAQVRFYMHQRWLQQPSLGMHERLSLDWPPSVVRWMRSAR